MGLTRARYLSVSEGSTNTLIAIMTPEDCNSPVADIFPVSLKGILDGLNSLCCAGKLTQSNSCLQSFRERYQNLCWGLQTSQPATASQVPLTSSTIRAAATFTQLWRRRNRSDCGDNFQLQNCGQLSLARRHDGSPAIGHRDCQAMYVKH